MSILDGVQRVLSLYAEGAVELSHRRRDASVSA